MDYYVYVYMDPTKPGNYKYKDFSFDFEPFYVGKGKDQRYKIHLLKVKNDNCKNLPKDNSIKKILNSGKDPIIIKYREDLSESDAFLLEIQMIDSIGRKDIGKGPLKNLTNGGEGNSERKFTDEHRMNLSLSRIGKTSPKQMENLKRIHERMKGNKRTLGFKFSEESIKKLSVSHYKPVLQVTKDGEILREFPSIKDAESYIGVSIKKVLRGKGKTAGGFIWRYKNNKD